MKLTVARHAGAIAVIVMASWTTVRAQPLPPVPFPPENPLTESKRVLGKILFWDEQLSSDNTMACGTCHIPSRGGTDPRIGTNPGLDGIPGSPDDKQASPGVVSADAGEDYVPDATFDLLPQVTGRSATPSIGAMFAPELFWDGRASSTFTDPETGLVSIPIGGALESQAVGPILSDVEMAHQNRDWVEVASKLAAVQPLVLASDVPADMQAALDVNPSYPDLFDAAFGDAAISAERIAFAIATYERTLVPDQTPWDRFIAGDAGAMTPGQIAGWNIFQGPLPCRICHAPPLFTNNTFRNVGLRPVSEDLGRQEVTGNPGDRGRFKVPTLRNAGLKATFMHNGMLSSMPQVLDFYAQVNGQVQFPDNRDPILPILIPPNIRPPLTDFLVNALTDPRVVAETFPFDRPVLHSQRQPANPSITGEFISRWPVP